VGELIKMNAIRKSRKIRKKKSTYMSDKAFADLKDALEGALAFERGERRDLIVTRLQASATPKVMAPKEIARICRRSTAREPDYHDASPKRSR
jgi:hypothetical protein